MGSEQHHPGESAARVAEGGLDARAVEGSMKVAEMFLHIHGSRQFILSENAPEFGPWSR